MATPAALLTTARAGSLGDAALESSRDGSALRSVRFQESPIAAFNAGGDSVESGVAMLTTPVGANAVGVTRRDLVLSIGSRSSWGKVSSRPTDKFGFFLVDAGIDTGGLVSEHSRETDSQQLHVRRVKKWLQMLQHWDAYVATHPMQLKRRVRKGIPDALRAAVWQRLSGATKLKADHPGMYARMLSATPALSDVQCIALDLPRTYPNHFLFSTSHIDSAPATPASALMPDVALSIGQRALRNVLRAFACYDPVVGYCMTEEHEILTSRGFMSLRELEAGGRGVEGVPLLCGYDPLRKALLYEPCLQLIVNPAAEQKMVEFSQPAEVEQAPGGITAADDTTGDGGGGEYRPAAPECAPPTNTPRKRPAAWAARDSSAVAAPSTRLAAGVGSAPGRLFAHSSCSSACGVSLVVTLEHDMYAAPAADSCERAFPLSTPAKRPGGSRGGGFEARLPASRSPGQGNYSKVPARELLPGAQGSLGACASVRLLAHAAAGLAAEAPHPHHSGAVPAHIVSSLGLHSHLKLGAFLEVYALWAADGGRLERCGCRCAGQGDDGCQECRGRGGGLGVVFGAASESVSSVQDALGVMDLRQGRHFHRQRKYEGSRVDFRVTCGAWVGVFSALRDEGPGPTPAAAGTPDGCCGGLCGAHPAAAGAPAHTSPCTRGEDCSGSGSDNAGSAHSDAAAHRQQQPLPPPQRLGDWVWHLGQEPARRLLSGLSHHNAPSPLDGSCPGAWASPTLAEEVGEKGAATAAAGKITATSAAILTRCPRLRDDAVRLALHAGYSPHFQRVRMEAPSACSLIPHTDPQGKGSCSGVAVPLQASSPLSPSPAAPPSEAPGWGWSVTYSDAPSAAQPTLQRATDVRSVPYSGRTWCVTVPSGFIIARRVRRASGGTGPIIAASRPLITGNCQGMAFLAGLLLTYMPEEDAFWVLVALMHGEKHALAGMFRPGLPRFAEVMSVFSTLVKQHTPRLAAHLESLGVDHAMYASQWFLTLFTYSFPFDLVTRVWDTFLAEGWKAIYRVALGVLAANQSALLAMDFDDLMPALKSLASAVPASAVLSMAQRIPLRTATLQRLARDYQRANATHIAARIASATADAVRKETMLQEQAMLGRARSRSATSSSSEEGPAGEEDEGGSDMDEQRSLTMVLSSPEEGPDHLRDDDLDPHGSGGEEEGVFKVGERGVRAAASTVKRPALDVTAPSSLRPSRGAAAAATLTGRQHTAANHRSALKGARHHAAGGRPVSSFMTSTSHAHGAGGAGPKAGGPTPGAAGLLVLADIPLMLLGESPGVANVAVGATQAPAAAIGGAAGRAPAPSGASAAVASTSDSSTEAATAGVHRTLWAAPHSTPPHPKTNGQHDKRTPSGTVAGAAAAAPAGEDGPRDDDDGSGGWLPIKAVPWCPLPTDGSSTSSHASTAASSLGERPGNKPGFEANSSDPASADLLAKGVNLLLSEHTQGDCGDDDCEAHDAAAVASADALVAAARSVIIASLSFSVGGSHSGNLRSDAAPAVQEAAAVGASSTASSSHGPSPAAAMLQLARQAVHIEPQQQQGRTAPHGGSKQLHQTDERSHFQQQPKGRNAAAAPLAPTAATAAETGSSQPPSSVGAHGRSASAVAEESLRSPSRIPQHVVLLHNRRQLQRPVDAAPPATIAPVQQSRGTTGGLPVVAQLPPDPAPQVVMAGSSSGAHSRRQGQSRRKG